MDKILIANRGEIACRIARTASRLGIPTVAVYSSADRNALHRFACTESYLIGGGESKDSYLCIDKILHVAEVSKATMIHPGYGFLSENAEFAKAVIDAGLSFIGPSPETIALAGSKVESKRAVEEAGVPLLKSLPLKKKSNIKKFIDEYGFPLLVKAAAGGGGRGMRIVSGEQELDTAMESAAREAMAFFNDDTLFLEPYISNARHIEVQIICDQNGDALALAERDCTLQRNHQKVIEEAPAPALREETRKKIHEAALKAAEVTNYTNAGTVEFLVTEKEDFYFLEINSRLQVEHPITEDLFGIDLVEFQIGIAQGKSLANLTGGTTPVPQEKHFIEARICSESPEDNFVASTGRLLAFQFPQSDFIRLDTGYEQGKSVSHYYDSLLAKLIVSGEDRSAAIKNTIYALENSHIAGIKTNRSYLLKLLKSEPFENTTHHTTTAGEDKYKSSFIHDPYQIIALAMLSLHLPDEKLTGDVTLGFRLAGRGYKTRELELATKNYTAILSYVTQNRDCHVRVESEQDTKEYTFTNTVEFGDYLQTTCGERILSFFATDTGEKQLWLSLHGREHLIRYEKSGTRASATSSDSQAMCLKSPLPGKILTINVSPGDTVALGDLLLTMESMKMEHPIHAERNAKIETVSVKEGEVVESETELIQFS